MQVALEAQSAPRDAQVSLLLTDDADIRRLNRTYRGRDEPTDVLAFSQREGEAGALSGLLGDVVISLETADRQAARLGHSLEREVGLLALHGLLHLLGWRDDTAAERARMRRRALRLLNSVEL